jgi:hypothetical protein
MTTIRDLHRWNLVFDDPAILAVGWLGPGVDYPTGPVPREAFDRLQELCRRPWQPLVSAGPHFCELCQFPPGWTGEVYVPGEGCIYVAPTGIVHYVAAHWYRPPDVFLKAALDCPPMASMAYRRAFLANGGRGLIRHISAQRPPSA